MPSNVIIITPFLHTYAGVRSVSVARPRGVASVAFPRHQGGEGARGAVSIHRALPGCDRLGFSIRFTLKGRGKRGICSTPEGGEQRVAPHPFYARQSLAGASQEPRRSLAGASQEQRRSLAGASQQPRSSLATALHEPRREPLIVSQKSRWRPSGASQELRDATQ